MLRLSSWVSLVSLVSLLAGCGEAPHGDEASDESSETGESTSDDTTSDDTTSGGTTSGSETTTAADSTTDSTTTDTGNPDCTGPQGLQPLPAQYQQPAQPTQPGSSWAYFELTDFQPQSCNFGQTYGLESFKGRVTLLALMRSSCMICQGTIEYLEQMQAQLELEGHEVWFVVINQPSYDASQQEFIDRVSFPLLQDTLEVKAWDLFSQLEPLEGTDDLFIYTAEGTLSSYFSYAADNPTIKLETQAGWDNVYDAILAAM